MFLPCCWSCAAKDIGEWLQMGNIVNVYIPIGLVLLILGSARWWLADYEAIIGIVRYLVILVILLLIFQQRRAWVTKFATGEKAFMSCLISWFCWSCNYGQMGGHKSSQPNVVVVQNV